MDRQGLETACTEFWDWFVANATNLRSLLESGQTERLEQEISPRVDKVDPEIAWEVGRDEAGQASITLTAEGNPRLRAIVECLFRNRKSIPDWTVYSYRQPKTRSALEALLRSQGYDLNLEDVFVSPAIAPSKHRVDVTVVSPELASVEPDSERTRVTFFILDGLLGEDLVEGLIGSVEVAATKEKKAMPITKMQGFLKELLGG